MENQFRITPAALVAAAAGDFVNLVAAATPGGIERQEAAGQARLCRESSRLPIRMTEHTWEDIEREWGIQRGEVVDKIFYAVHLPEGWEIQPTDHSMWSNLVDAGGAERAAIFFKAAFYDFNAHMSLSSRYFLKFKTRNDLETSLDLPNNGYDVVDRRTGMTIFVGPWASYRNAYEACKPFLVEHFPDYKNPFAYWND